MRTHIGHGRDDGEEAEHSAREKNKTKINEQHIFCADKPEIKSTCHVRFRHLTPSKKNFEYTSFIIGLEKKNAAMPRDEGGEKPSTPYIKKLDRQFTPGSMSINEKKSVRYGNKCSMRRNHK